MTKLNLWDKIIVFKIKKNFLSNEHFFISYSKVQSIALVLDYDNYSVEDEIEKIKKRFIGDGKKIKIILLKKNKIQILNYTLITYKRIFFWIKKKCEDCEQIFSKNFDLAIGFDTKRNLILEYFISKLKAKQVILPYFDEDMYADLLLKVKSNSLEDFINQTILFLKKIKTK